MKRIFLTTICILFTVVLLQAQDNIKKVKYYQSVDIECMMGSFEKETTFPNWGLSLQETHGILFNPHFMLGMDIGVQYFQSNKRMTEKLHSLGFYAGIDFRYFILKNHLWTPFLMVNFGGGIKMQDSYLDLDLNSSSYLSKTYWKLPSLYFGYTYQFAENKNVYTALGFDATYLSPSLRIGVHF